MDTENKVDGYYYNCGEVNAKNLVQAPAEKCPVSPVSDVIVRIPVLIAHATVEADVEACIDFPCYEDFYEIKRIKKNVFLTQGRIIPLVQPDGEAPTGKLYLKGFVEKNIEYATADCVSRKKDIINGDIKHHTVKVPFQVVTLITFRSPIIINDRGPLTERTIYCDTSKESCCFDCDDGLKGRSFCESDFSETVTFYDRPFVKLDSFRIFELDFNKDPEPLCPRYPGSDSRKEEEEGQPEGYYKQDCGETHKAFEYDKVEEKFALFLCVRVLQDQYVRVC
ncbi:hypothetical protein CPJCM30710_21800 [Clostridium polyendosporum]|uniref:DUF7852 domain-containing protein n=1 Tax=Clostridium polyendosporum TaxID=69208 RepID=A0A919S0A7_9CLOT|nr:hypothetical protein [Clostridium polyendosporum]GIM29514.1 hypothetical protein CPJCM30710_21800 [Clostridium polyendosporum]